eukprot:6462283-Amphidinium_carterae.1
MAISKMNIHALAPSRRGQASRSVCLRCYDSRSLAQYCLRPVIVMRSLDSVHTKLHMMLNCRRFVLCWQQEGRHLCGACWHAVDLAQAAAQQVGLPSVGQAVLSALPKEKAVMLKRLAQYVGDT